MGRISENMAAMGGGKRQRMEAPAEDKFLESLRILAVDDDCVCLKVMEAVLRRCKYHRESPLIPHSQVPRAS